MEASVEMSSLLPHTPTVESEPAGELRLQLGVDATAVIEALHSDTAQQLLASLHHGPATASTLARINDVSLQTVCYHLDNLREADLVHVVDRWYSRKGREMDVYAPTTDRLILEVTPESAHTVTTR